MPYPIPIHGIYTGQPRTLCGIRTGVANVAMLPTAAGRVTCGACRAAIRKQATK